MLGSLGQGIKKNLTVGPHMIFGSGHGFPGKVAQALVSAVQVRVNIDLVISIPAAEG
jgi:hypothetical protein